MRGFSGGLRALVVKRVVYRWLHEVLVWLRDLKISEGFGGPSYSWFVGDRGEGKCTFASDDLIMTWVVGYCAATYNIFHVTADGRKPYEKHRGLGVNLKLPGYAENVFFTPYEDWKAKCQLKLEPQCFDGLFIGIVECDRGRWGEAIWPHCGNMEP